MKNFKKIRYQKYYVTDENGKHTQVSREVCLAQPESPTKDNPYKQRWYYDIEAGYIVRLARTKANEDIHRFNGTSIKKEERYRDNKFSCIWKGKKTAKCDQDCNRCNRKNTSRTVELDKTWTNDDSDTNSLFTPTDETQNILEDLEDKELMTAILQAYGQLPFEDKLLFNCLIEKKAKKDIAHLLGLKSVDGVRYRELELRKKLLKNKDLKNILRK